MKIASKRMFEAHNTAKKFKNGFSGQIFDFWKNWQNAFRICWIIVNHALGVRKWSESVLDHIDHVRSHFGEKKFWIFSHFFYSFLKGFWPIFEGSRRKNFEKIDFFKNEASYWKSVWQKVRYSPILYSPSLGGPQIKNWETS